MSEVAGVEFSGDLAPRMFGLFEVSDNPTYPANFCPIGCGATMSHLKAGTTHFAQ
jgi:hypothetical protein